MASTGRMATQKSQCAIPIKTEPKVVREAFISEDGYTFSFLWLFSDRIAVAAHFLVMKNYRYF